MKTMIIEKILKEKLIAIVRGVYGEDCANSRGGIIVVRYLKSA